MTSSWLAALALLAGAPLWAQEERKPEPPKAGEEDELTPDKALAMLKEIEELMSRSEVLLNDSARGKALATEEKLVDKLKDLLKEDEKSNPATLQKQILEKIERMMKKTEGQQKDAAEKLGEIIRKAKGS